MSDWNTGGCMGPPEILPIHLKQFWRLRVDLRVVDRVPMMGERTVLPRGLRKHWRRCTQHTRLYSVWD